MGSREVAVTEEQRNEPGALVGWYRRDDMPKLLWLLWLSMVPTLAGSILVGLAYPRIDEVDPLGVRGAVPVDAASTAPRPRAWPAGFPDSEAGVWGIFVGGLLLIAAGPAAVILGLRRSWRREAMLLLDVDGLVHEDETGALRVRWDDVERVTYDPERDAVALRLRSGAPPIRLGHRFAGVSNAQLAQRLEDVRRKASFGLLPQQRRGGR